MLPSDWTVNAKSNVYVAMYSGVSYLPYQFDELIYANYDYH